MAIRLGSAYGQVVLDATGVRKGTAEAERAFLGLEKKGVAAMAALGLSIGGMGVLLKKTVDKALGLSKEFETSTARLELAAGKGAESFETLHDAAIAVGGDSRLLGVSASGASDAMEGLYKSGLNAAVIFGDLNGYMAGTVELGGALRASIDLAAASELDMVQSSDLAAVALNTFGAELETDAEKAEFINKALDNFVRAADASVAEVSDLAAALTNVGPDAARMGFTIEEVNNALAILSTRGIKGAEAGTALKSMMLNMNRQTNDVVETLDALNISLYDAEGQMRSLPEIIGLLERAFGGLTDEQRDHYMQTLAGTYGLKAMSTLIAEGTTGWYAMAEATAHATGIQEKAARMAETLAGRQEALEGNVETLLITIGEKLMPVALDWTEWAIAMVDEHGPALVEVVGKIAEGFQWLSDGLQGQGTVLQNTIVQMGGVSLAAFGIGQAYKGLAPLIRPAIGEIGTLVSDLTTKFALMKEGAKAGEVAALGWSSSLAPVVAALAAVAAWLAVINTYRKIEAETEEKTEEVGDQWVQFLDRQAEAYGTATGVATAYLRKQEEIGRIFDEGGAAMQLFARKQDVVNANSEALNRTLVKSATSYEEYLAAIDRINAANYVTVQTGEQVNGTWQLVTKTVQQDVIEAMGRQTFEVLRGNAAMESGFIAARMMRQGVEEVAEAEAVAVTETRALASANRQAAETYLGQVNRLQELGIITRQEATGMRAVVVDEFGQIVTATENVQTAQAKLAEVAAGVWETFSQNVYTGVQNALTAYREGNKEMLAEQQAALGQMILNQATNMAATGQMTDTQLMDIRVAVQKEFGIVVDEAAVGRDHLLTLFADMAAGGKTSIDDILSYIKNIGPETEQMAKDVEEDIARANEQWVTYKGEVETATLEASKDMMNLGTDIETVLSTMETEIETAAGKFLLIGSAIEDLPTEHTFTFKFRTEGEIPEVPGAPPPTAPPGYPEGAYAAGTQYATGGWAWYGEEGPELGYVPRGTSILTAQETLGLVESAAELASALAAGGLGGAALADYRSAASAAPTVQMTAYVRDEVDIELLARRVAEYIRGRQ